MAFWMQSIAQGWLVVELTDSPFILGLLAFFRSVPMLVISPFGGVLADRVNRVRLLLTAQVVMGCTAVAIGLLVAFERIDIWHLAVASLVLGITFAVNMPARAALVSDLVPRRDIGNAVALNSATMNAARILGPSLAGFFIGVIGIAGTYFVQALGYVWSILNVIRIRPDQRERRVHASPLIMLREGFVYVLRSKHILALLLLGMAPAVFSMPAVILLPAFVKQDLGGGAADLGVLMSSLGVGALIGSMTVVIYSRFRHQGRALMVSVFLYGVLIVGLAFTRSMLTACLVMAVAGFFQAVYMALNQTIIQLMVPSRIRGRVLSIWMLGWGMTPLGLLPRSALAESSGTPVAMVLGGGLSTLVVLGVAVWGRELWNLQPDAEAGESEPACPGESQTEQADA